MHVCNDTSGMYVVFAFVLLPVSKKEEERFIGVESKPLLFFSFLKPLLIRKEMKHPMPEVFGQKRKRKPILSAGLLVAARLPIKGRSYARARIPATQPGNLACSSDPPSVRGVPPRRGRPPLAARHAPRQCGATTPLPCARGPPRGRGASQWLFPTCPARPLRPMGPRQRRPHCVGCYK